jgi:hypothetical protein
MNTWEYKVLDTYPGKGDTICVSSIDGSYLSNWEKGPHYIAVLNELGLEGWEAIAGSGYSSTIGNGFVLLKRPKVEI